MKRIGKLVRATDHETARPEYKDGLQAMWEDRWILLGEAGRVDWFQRHGHLPPQRNPMLGPTLGPLLVLRGVRGLSPGVVKGRVRRTW